jgi:hypothetical protein
MTYQIYSQQQLQLKSIARLKQIYSEIACPAKVSDKRCKDSWISAFVEDVGAAIAEYQASKIQKLSPAAPNEQALAQAELDSYIADQAQIVAPEPLTIVEISFDHHEYYADDKLVASISHDDNHLTQRWVVMVNEKEVFRANTLMRCDRFICTHYKDGSLPVQEEAGGQGAGGRGERFSPMHPAPCSLSSSTTGNEVMAQIFDECEKYGFEILNDGIYQNDVKLGEVGCIDGGWWVMRSGEYQQMPCNSAMDAVWWLSMVDSVPHTEAADCEELLDRPFEMLTSLDWELLREYAPVAESRELVTA